MPNRTARNATTETPSRSARGANEETGGMPAHDEGLPNRNCRPPRGVETQFADTSTLRGGYPEMSLWTLERAMKVGRVYRGLARWCFAPAERHRRRAEQKKLRRLRYRPEENLAASIS